MYAMKIVTIFFISIISMLFVSCTKKEQISSPTVAINKYDKAVLTYKVYKEDSGWGYKIYKNKKVFINQPIIPAINASVPFKTSEDAEKVAKFVIHKLQTQIGLPTLSPDELDSLGVLDSVLVKYK